jgi:GntR family transcriptional regulator
VRDRLREAILAGSLAPGERLPSEADLVARFGVSRITVRQALSELQAQKLIATVNGKGSYVTRPERGGAAGPMVGILEAMRRRGLEAHGRLVSNRVVRAAGAVAESLGVARGSPVGAVTILREIDGAPFAIGTSYLDPELAARLAAHDLANTDVVIALGRITGMRATETRVSVSAVPAPAGVARRLRCASGAPLLHIRTLTHDARHRPYCYSETDFRGDRMDYRVTLRT